MMSLLMENLLNVSLYKDIMIFLKKAWDFLKYILKNGKENVKEKYVVPDQ